MNDMEKMIDEQQRVYSRIAASGKEDEAELTKAMTFLVDGKIYGVEITFVREIIGVPHITVVPGVPDYILGIINVRSKVMPVVSLRRRFGIPEKEYDERTCTIIINYKDYSVGMIVDEVLDVLPVRKKNQTDIPSLERVNANKFIQYILDTPDGIKLVLDTKKLLFEDDLDEIPEE